MHAALTWISSPPPAQTRLQIPGEVARSALWSRCLGGQPPSCPRQRLPQGAERFLGTEHGVTAFRAIAPQAPSDHMAAGAWGWGLGGCGEVASSNYAQPPPRVWLTASLVGLTEVATKEEKRKVHEVENSSGLV